MAIFGLLSDLTADLGSNVSTAALFDFEGKTISEVRVDGVYLGQGTYDDATGTFTQLGTMPNGISADDLDNFHLEGGTVYATIQHSFNDHDLLALGDDGNWTVVPTNFLGGFATGPRPQFTVNGLTYFVANSNDHGIELFRINDDGILEILTDTVTPTNNSFHYIGLSVFEHAGTTYFFTNLWNLEGLLLFIDDNEEVAVAGSGDGQYGPSFGHIIDVMNETVLNLQDGEDAGQPDYILTEDGRLMEVEFPDGEVKKIEFHHGTIYVSIEPPEGGFTVWALSTDGNWQELFVVDEADGTQRVIDFGHTGEGADVYFGGETAEQITAFENDAIIHAGAGRDNVVALGGDDLVYGGSGGDTIDAGEGKDTVFGGAGKDKVFGGRGSDDLAGGKKNDVIKGGGGSDFVAGGKGQDLLFGGTGSDTLEGGKGKDTLVGGTGNDVLEGGSGKDVFLFADGFGEDTIVDFKGSEDLDRIDLVDVTDITAFGDLTANHMVLLGNDVQIYDAPGNSITLLNISLSDLVEDDFIF
ncbi:hypothetical protein N9O61_01420 [Octadecabacter sp.]|nr:hypothetical protein [Octadecabacter sp.]